MLGYSDDPRAWWLTRGMARVTGVSLPEAVVEGWLSRSELAGLVQVCRDCTADRGCESWLAVSGPASRMPDFCPNKPAIEALAP
jgi:Family of unknown function (DUF6455)